MSVVPCYRKTRSSSYDTCRLLVRCEREESALAVYWISDGIDRCRVGFLPHHLVKQWQQFNGRIAQVVDLYQGSDSPTKQRKNVRNCGCCEAVLIDNCGKESDN
jgi:hypothetical protein